MTWCDFIETQWQCNRCGFQRSDLFSPTKGRDAYRRALPEEAYSWKRSKKPWVMVPEGTLLVAAWEME
jgi:hypothetical protein